MKMTQTGMGPAELRAALRDRRGLFVTVFFFTAVVNLLMLAAPVYMLQVYDRVLGSQSEATLIALSGLMIFLFMAMGLLDHLRGRIAARIGAVFQDRLDGRVFLAAARLSVQFPDDPLAQSARRDLEAVQRLLISPGFMALFDLPWAAVFLTLLFIFHPLCGAFALAGGGALILITLLNERMSRGPPASAHRDRPPGGRSGRSVPPRSRHAARPRHAGQRPPKVGGDAARTHSCSPAGL